MYMCMYIYTYIYISPLSTDRLISRIVCHVFVWVICKCQMLTEHLFDIIIRTAVPVILINIDVHVL